MEKVKNKVTVLVSSIALPSIKIGSWSNRISSLLRDSPYFDQVLSPTQSPDQIFKFCEKRKNLPIIRKRRQWYLENWVGKDYLLQLKDIEKAASEIDIVVMDDLMLLEIMVSFKLSSKAKVKVTFSFHGHQLILPPTFGVHVDKVFFLTNRGYQESLLLNEIFTPEVHIVGNGVNSSQFFPISNSEKLKFKSEFGFASEDEIIVWMANERPKKGLHLFLKIAGELLKMHPKIKLMVVGNKNPIPIQNDRIKVFGQVPNKELPRYLQIADYYFFTTLWKEGFGLSMVEAAKCGCTIIASNSGGVPDVLENLNQAYLVKSPNIVEDWIETFQLARKGRSNYSPYEIKEELGDFHSYLNWEKRYLKALEY